MMKARALLAAALLGLCTSAFAASGDPSAGEKKSVPCAACHGKDGVSIGPDFPNLAGQYADYIETALKHYQNGKRTNPIMQLQAKDLKPKDIMDLAAYFSSRSGLQVKH